MKRKTHADEQPETQPKPQPDPTPPPQTQPMKNPGKPIVFHPGTDPVPVPNTVIQHPLYSDPQAAKPI